MSERIRVGDLVRVIRDCDCDPMNGIGVIFRVERIIGAYRWNCFRGPGLLGPHTLTNGEPLAYGRTWKGDGHHPIAWLRRIPPLSELETERTDERVTA